MQPENSRNTILFVVCSALILGLYFFFVQQPQMKARQLEAAARAEAAQASGQTDGQAGTDVGGLSSTGPAPVTFVTDRAQALGTARVPIQTPRLQGSLSLMGGRIDDLFLSDYDETLAANSPPVELFRPQGMEHAFYAQFGWNGANIAGGVPGPQTLWRLTSGTTLTPETPITLTWDNEQGLRFTRVVSIDDDYMFTITDTVANLGTQPIIVAPFGQIERQGIHEQIGRNQIVHEGAIGTFLNGDRYTTTQIKYKDWAKKPMERHESTGGWLGITDKYWLAALIPAQDEEIDAAFSVTDQSRYDLHRATMQGESHTINPGRQVTSTQHLFAGAKRNEILSTYEREMNLPRFIYAIDWGILWFLTRPIFLVVEFFFGILKNFGLAILALTLTVRLIMFPLANKSYESMSKMRTLQPKMEEIKKKHPDDPQKQQQETMALYQREKINPLAGCLPLLVQIPVFYAVYKMLTVTIEMRHAPFFGWLRDLSAPDPTNIWNLFGLIPWNPASAPLIGGLIGGGSGGFTLGLSVLAIVYGLTMWLHMAMSPTSPDPVQRRIFQLMPVAFTFIMAGFPAGLLLYWGWSNILTIFQQYIIMHRLKAENPIDTFLARFKKA